MTKPPRRSILAGVYKWLIPTVLGLMLFVLFAIVVAVLAAAFGVWPVGS